MMFVDVLKKRRKELKLTQEMIAQRLGVSTPAVHKWESGKGFPDITLLIPLARLLEVDLNALLGFFHEPSQEEILSISSQLFSRHLEGDGQLILEEVQELLQTYPSSYRLHYEVAKTLEALLVFRGEENSEFSKIIQECYGFAVKSSEMDLHFSAQEGLFRRLVVDGDEERAEELLETFPNLTFDKVELRKYLYRRQERKAELEELLQGQLYGDGLKVLLELMDLVVLAKEGGRGEVAISLRDKVYTLLDVFEVEEVQKTLILLQFAVLFQEEEETIKQLRDLYHGLGNTGCAKPSLLYDKLKKKEDEEFSSLMIRILRQHLGESEFDFVREREEFIRLEKKMLVDPAKH